METDIVQIESIGGSLVERSRELTDILSFSEITNPDLVFLFPATSDVDEDFERSLAELNSELDCPLLGVSVGGFATSDNESIQTHGAAAVFLKDIEFKIEEVEDPWTGDKDQMQDKIGEDGTTITFETGAFGPSQKEEHIWSKITEHSGKVLSYDFFGERDAVLKLMRSEMKKHSLGYSNFFEMRFDQVIFGKDILNFNSGDLGDFSKGFEIHNSEITEGESAYILNLKKTIESGSLGDSDLSFENGRVQETFENLETSGRFGFRFDGQTIPELKEEYPIQKDISQGNFIYYFIIEEDEATYSMPANADLNLIVSPRPLEKVKKAHLVRAPSFSEYIDQYRKSISEIEGLVHISINPPQFDSYRSSIDEVIKETNKNFEDFLITTDNALREGKKKDHNFPKYIIYQK